MAKCAAYLAKGGRGRERGSWGANGASFCAWKVRTGEEGKTRRGIIRVQWGRRGGWDTVFSVLRSINIYYMDDIYDPFTIIQNDWM